MLQASINAASKVQCFCKSLLLLPDGDMSRVLLHFQTAGPLALPHWRLCLAEGSRKFLSRAVKSSLRTPQRERNVEKSA